MPHFIETQFSVYLRITLELCHEHQMALVRLTPTSVSRWNWGPFLNVKYHRKKHNKDGLAKWSKLVSEFTECPSGQVTQDRGGLPTRLNFNIPSLKTGLFWFSDWTLRVKASRAPYEDQHPRPPSLIRLGVTLAARGRAAGFWKWEGWGYIGNQWGKEEYKTPGEAPAWWAKRKAFSKWKGACSPRPQVTGMWAVSGGILTCILNAWWLRTSKHITIYILSFWRRKSGLYSIQYKNTLLVE